MFMNWFHHGIGTRGKMAKLDRVHQKIFASTAPSSDIGVIGSLHEGNPTEAASVQDIQSLAAFEAGIRSIVIGENSPIIEEDNALYKLITYQLAYLLQNGVPDWSDSTTYYEDQFCKNNGIIYRSKEDSNTGNDVSNTLFWEECVLAPSKMQDQIIPARKVSKNIFLQNILTGGGFPQGPISYGVDVPLYWGGTTTFGIMGRLGQFSGFTVKYSKTVAQGEITLLVKDHEGFTMAKTVLDCPEVNTTYTKSGVTIGFNFDQAVWYDTTRTYTLHWEVYEPDPGGSYSLAIAGDGYFYARKDNY